MPRPVSLNLAQGSSPSCPARQGPLDQWAKRFCDDLLPASPSSILLDSPVDKGPEVSRIQRLQQGAFDHPAAGRSFLPNPPSKISGDQDGSTKDRRSSAPPHSGSFCEFLHLWNLFRMAVLHVVQIRLPRDCLQQDRLRYLQRIRRNIGLLLPSCPGCDREFTAFSLRLMVSPRYFSWNVLPSPNTDRLVSVGFRLALLTNPRPSSGVQLSMFGFQSHR